MESFIANSPWILAIFMLWVLPWKGISLWKSARLGHKWWFIVLLIVNTAAILDIIYIFGVAKRASAQRPTSLGLGEKEVSSE